MKRLFEEELKDRETNSFQGIGSALEILTFLLMKYNREGTYDSLFERAKTLISTAPAVTPQMWKFLRSWKTVTFMTAFP